ncbi:MAG: hypothetical protein RL846_20870 [Deltaproteobacteria bacterium]
MNPRARALAVGALCCAGAPRNASASEVQTSSTATVSPQLSDDRDADIFGTDDRDDAIFGAPSEDRDAAKFGAETATASRDARVLSGGEGLLDRLASAAEAADDYLDIGGTLWLWGQWDASRSGEPEAFPLRSPSFFEVYLDARPSNRVRGFVKVRTNYDFTVAPGDTDFTGQPVDSTRFALDQAWLKFDIARRVFVTFGKERQRWGSGRLWNPTDFLNPGLIDPFAFFDLRLGVPILKLHYPVESLGWNFYAIAQLDGANRIDEVGGAFRAEFVFAKTEIAASAAVRKDQPLRLGLDVTSGVWWFDLRAELALRYNEKRSFYRGRLAVDVDENGDEILTLPTAFDRSNDWLPQAVLGAEIQLPYSDRDNVTLVLEYFYNSVSFEDESLYLVPLAAGFGAFGVGGTSAVPFNPLFLGEHYIALSAVLFGPGDWDDTTFVFAGVTNLSDQSTTLNLNYSVQLLSYLQLNAFLRMFVGPAGGAFTFEVDPAFFGVGLPPGLLSTGVSLRLDL